MGFFDRFRKKPAELEPEPPGPAPVAVAVAVVREGMSPPTDDEMRALLLAHAPELADLPRRGLAQPRWWRQDDWMQSGMRQIGAVLAPELGTDPDETTWRVVRDELGARVGIVELHKG